MTESALTPAQKAAILVMELGLDSSVGLMEHLSPKTFHNLVRELQDLPPVTPDQRRAVLEEFTGQIERSDDGAVEGKAFVKAILRRTVDESFQGIDMLRHAEVPQLLEIVRREHPQVGAFVLSSLQPKQAAALLKLLTPAQQQDLSTRVALLRPPNQETLGCLDRALRTYLNSFASHKEQVGGVSTLVQVLQDAGRAVERNVLESLQKEHPELAAAMRKMMFTFEDLPRLSDLDFQKVLRNVEGRTLSLALKNAPDEVKELVMRNLSERARNMLEGDIEALARVRASEVEKAQQELIDCVRLLIAGGEISLESEEEEESQ